MALKSEPHFISISLTSSPGKRLPFWIYWEESIAQNSRTRQPERKKYDPLGTLLKPESRREAPLPIRDEAGGAAGLGETANEGWSALAEGLPGSRSG